MAKNHRAITFLGILLLIAANIARANNPPQQPVQDVWMTVFVHGIMSIKPHISLSNFARFMTDDVQNTVYSTTVELMRQDPIFFQNQAMQEVGLKKIATDRVEKGYSSGAMALSFEEIAQFAQPDTTPHYYYTYGWSGLLSPKRRYIDAKLLYIDLGNEIASLQTQGLNPKIRLIGYSHGGNVLLNLGKIHQEEPTLPSFTIDQLVLLGTPIQHETDYLINDPIFACIYHIYSLDDRVQKLDFFSFNRFFSGRVFKSRRDFELPDKLVQIQLKCSRDLRFKKTDDPKLLTASAHKKSRPKKLRNASPGHSELWFFSWTPQNYRTHFPLNPLPLASLVPLIIQQADTFCPPTLQEKPALLLDIRPNYEVIVVKNKNNQQVLSISKFLSRSEFANLSEKVLAFKPENYTAQRYNDGIKTAYLQATKLRHHEGIALKHARKERIRVQNKRLLEEKELFFATS
ncbi:MAG TPA: hypothetical protein VLG71_01570 [Candidatus Limnocylindria bacterium]|nr:hypothetical protein [Candidatus Limnocylindria bacterium]